MRQILSGLIIASILIGCSEKESLTFDEELQQLTESSQFFKISNDKGDTIKTKNGTRIIIKPNTFIFNDGQDVKEPIQIELKEVFDKSDMILNGLGTVSDGRLLESFGMIHLSATSEGRGLGIIDNGSIAISIPNKRKGDNGELFYGSKTDSIVNWKYAGTTNDTIEVMTTYTQTSDSLFVKEATYKYVDGERMFVSDSTYRLYGQFDITMGMEYKTPDFYHFDIRNLGWINCDRFIEITEKENLDIELKNYSRPFGYMVFEDINSVMWIPFNEKGTATIENLPKNYSVYLIVLDKNDKDFMWSKKDVKIGLESKVTLDMKPIDKATLTNELRSLDK